MPLVRMRAWHIAPVLAGHVFFGFGFRVLEFRDSPGFRVQGFGVYFVSGCKMWPSLGCRLPGLGSASGMRGHESPFDLTP